MDAAEIEQTLTIGMAVIHPPIQVGRGRKLPSESDEDRKKAAQLIREHLELCGIKWFRSPPAKQYPA
ncbi:MAG TPA: hypothetical protein VG328_23315 [Stellaceae bacterium]|jgi:hypothetical protein|nr:hypothetical protein [Stellaceae bacterium]